MTENKDKSLSSDEKDKSRKDDVAKGVQNAAFLGATEELVERYGGAVKEHIASYTGVDNELGIKYKRSLKSVSESKVNPDYQKTNIKQQSGFSAEIKESANFNAESRIKGTGLRKVRTDDMGSVNDQLRDHVVIDGNGNIVAGSQMKFVGKSPSEALKKLRSKPYQKYLDNNVDIEVPKDFYSGIQAEADAQIKSIGKQLKVVTEKGDTKTAAKLQEQLDSLKKIKKNLKKSSVTNKQALFAREHPALSAFGSELKIAHRAGVKGAGIGATIGAGISGIMNFYEVHQGELSPKEAFFNTARDVASSAVNGYIITAGATEISGIMRNCESTISKSLANSNFPAAILTLAIDTSKVLLKYFRSEITGTEALEQMGEEGYTLLFTSAYATAGKMLVSKTACIAVGQIVIPVPGIGAIIGGLVGFAVASASYQYLLSALQEKELAHERRMKIEKACREHIEMIRAYQEEINETINNYLSTNITSIQTYFDSILSSFRIGEIEKAVYSINGITMLMGQEPICHTLDEFDALMNSDKTIML